MGDGDAPQGYAKVTASGMVSRAMGEAERSGATLAYSFNGRASGGNETLAEVGSSLRIRVVASYGGKQIATGEMTHKVVYGRNNVTVILEEDREVIPYRELSTAQVGDVICANGKVLSASDIYPKIQSQAVAVVYKVDSANTKVWAVGKVHARNIGWSWSTNANTKITKLITQLDNSTAGQLTFTSGTYTDGSTGLAFLRDEVSDATTDADLRTYYPAWDYACNYGKNQSLTGNLATGWYLPSLAELFDIWKTNSAIENALSAAGGSTFADNYYWSSSQYDRMGAFAYYLNFTDGAAMSNSKGVYSYYACAVRVFTY